MPKIVDPESQRDEIRRAARRTFSRRGVRGTGLAHVAKAAGIGRSTLYHYYPDKDTLLRDLVRGALENERAVFRACLRAEGSAKERVRHLLDSLLTLFDEWAALGRMLYDFRLSDTARFRRFFREVRAELSGVLRTGQSEGELSGDFDPDLAAASLIGAVDGLLFQFFLEPDAFPDREALRRQMERLAERALEA